MPVYLLTLFAKNEQDNLSRADCRDLAMKKFLAIPQSNYLHDVLQFCPVQPL